MNNFLKSLKENLLEIKEVKENEFEVIVSTDTIDRSGESITQDWIDIKEYMKNPVVLVNHNYTVESIVWKTIKVWQDGNKTMAKWIFSQTNPKAKLVQDLYNEGMLKAVSIWFIPVERKNGDVITKSRMLEFSFVAVPCNPEALDTTWKNLYKKWINAGLIIDHKKKSMEKEISLKDILVEVKNLSEKIDNITKSLADDKAEAKKVEDAIEKKQTLQNIDRAIGEALKNFKLL